MAKIIAWLIVVFVVLLALRLVNLRNARARRAAARTGEKTTPARAPKGGVPMVRCVRCGVYLPRAEARSIDGGYACIAGPCASHA